MRADHRLAACIVSALAISALPLLAQGSRGATITGSVRDSSAQPVRDADVIARPGNYRTRTDSAGRFTLMGLDGGGYLVLARKIGYTAERWDVSVSNNGRLEVNFVLGRRTQLDTVVVTAKRDCPTLSFDGFECRRHAGGGLFLDYPDIDEYDQIFTADLFRRIPGFRVRMRSTRAGVVPVPVAGNGYGCISEVVDGKPASAANPAPSLTRDLMAMEVYAKPDSVPPGYQRYTWPQRNAARTGRCSVVVYWTIWAPHGGSSPDGMLRTGALQ